MQAKTVVQYVLSKKYATTEIDKILGRISSFEIARIQRVIDKQESGDLSLIISDAVKKAKRGAIPHSVCLKRAHPLVVPIGFVAVVVSRKFGVHPVVGKYSIASFVALSGAYLACNPVSGIPHFVWDAISYTIHGIGAAPFAEAILRRVDKKKEVN